MKRRDFLGTLGVSLISGKTFFEALREKRPREYEEIKGDIQSETGTDLGPCLVKLADRGWNPVQVVTMITNIVSTDGTWINKNILSVGIRLRLVTFGYAGATLLAEGARGKRLFPLRVVFFDTNQRTKGNIDELYFPNCKIGEVKSWKGGPGGLGGLVTLVAFPSETRGVPIWTLESKKSKINDQGFLVPVA